MCGIIAYTGRRAATPLLKAGLKRLEYRGYDSAGIAVVNAGGFSLVKRKGRVEELDALPSPVGNTGIGHTRWATHGAPSQNNAHPHVYGKFALVHNGIIENAHALRRLCEGERFCSETDSEVIVHLIARAYKGDFLGAVAAAVKQLAGSYALAVLCSDFPQSIVLARGGSPLVVGESAAGLFAASDVPAIAASGMKLMALREGEFALLQAGRVRFFDQELRPVEGEALVCDVAREGVEKGEYAHFMQKEMKEIPAVMARSVLDLLSDARYTALVAALGRAKRIQMVACGTAYHSALCAKYAIESLARIPTEVYIASEYRYARPIVQRDTLVFAVSQSGETADTLAAASLARELGAPVVAVTNVPYSSLTRLAHFVLPTDAGREVAVAATKSFSAQLCVLYSVAVALARIKRGVGELASLTALPLLADRAQAAGSAVGEWTAHFCKAKSVYFIGRGQDYCAALEGSLKLKEISYLPGEGYPAGELKHGTLALVDDATPVVAVMTGRALAEKTMNAVHEVYARGAKVFLITPFARYAAREEVFSSVLIPACEEAFSPALSVLPLQQLAYCVALARGNDPDKPRNLAKSVTVE